MGLLNLKNKGAGQLRSPTQELTASGAVNPDTETLLLNHATVAIAATMSAPQGGETILIEDSSASGTAAHTVTLPTGVTWDGTNRVLTLNAPGEFVYARAISATRYFVIASSGAAFS